MWTKLNGFPEDYYHFGTKDSVEISDNETRQWIHETINRILKDIKNKNYFTDIEGHKWLSDGIASGNTRVTVKALYNPIEEEWEFESIVSKNFYELDVRFTEDREGNLKEIDD